MIHPTAIIGEGAQISREVSVGPYSIIGNMVSIGRGTKIGAHSVISGKTSIGKNNTIFNHVSIGEVPQDKKYNGEDTTLTIGDNNIIREFCTFNTGTIQDRGDTYIGNKNWIMAYVHIAHDCYVGNGVIMANSVQLGGHIIVGDNAFLGGFTGIHQFCRVGAHAMTGVGSVVLADIPPFVTAMGNRAKPYGINSEGLKRFGFEADTITEIKRAYKVIYRAGLTMEQAVKKLRAQSQGGDVIEQLVDFLVGTNRSIIR